MTKDKNKKKKDKEQEKDEGIPLKVMNELRRANRMAPFTKEEHDKKKALVKAGSQRDSGTQVASSSQELSGTQRD